MGPRVSMYAAGPAICVLLCLLLLRGLQISPVAPPVASPLPVSPPLPDAATLPWGLAHISRHRQDCQLWVYVLPPTHWSHGALPGTASAGAAPPPVAPGLIPVVPRKIY